MCSSDLDRERDKDAERKIQNTAKGVLSTLKDKEDKVLYAANFLDKLAVFFFTMLILFNTLNYRIIKKILCILNN